MTEVRWTEQATENLEAIKAFISQDSPAYALAVVGRPYHAVGELAQFPDSGRIVPERGRPELRELVRPPYEIVYRRRPQLVEILGTCALMAALAAWLPGCSTGDQVEAISFSGDPLGTELGGLGRLLGDARIVLLGENGHGVREFTEAKVEIIKWLHRDHGFDLVVFESGLYECDAAWRRLRDTDAAEALEACLRYPLEHAEAVPLFDYMKAAWTSGARLAFSGMDFQSQGFDSEARPTDTFGRLRDLDAGLARRLARADTALLLLPQHGGLGDKIYQYASRHADTLNAEYRRAAELTSGVTRLVFSLTEGWIDRLAIRGRAEVDRVEPLPGRYYELRDEWMARAVAFLADSVGAQRKVVVWLHNDHARTVDSRRPVTVFARRADTSGNGTEMTS